VEFVVMTGLLISLTALSIDAMLPALPEIGRDLGIKQGNDTQLVISIVFLGMAFSPLVYGPLSDVIGRKPAIVIGVAIFIVGCLMSIFATSYWVMMLGRLLQGVGVGGPRTVMNALVRDLYKGREMAQMMSFVIAVFILVPIIAPAIGQVIQIAAGWRMIFVMFLVLALIGVGWLTLRQPETLPREKRVPFSFANVWAGIADTCSNRKALGYTLTASPIFGAFVGYLISSQQMLQEQYALGTLFPAYFAGLAMAIGAASLANGALVIRFGMRRLCWIALIVMTLLSIAYSLYAWRADGHPSLMSLMIYFTPVFFCFGIVAGNFNALAMEPMGHVAGIASAFITSVTMLASMVLGTTIAQAYDGTVLPIVFGFTLMSTTSLALMVWTERTGN